jgi:hypothetical protein
MKNPRVASRGFRGSDAPEVKVACSSANRVLALVHLVTGHVTPTPSEQLNAMVPAQGPGC